MVTFVSFSYSVCPNSLFVTLLSRLQVLLAQRVRGLSFEVPVGFTQILFGSFDSMGGGCRELFALIPHQGCFVGVTCSLGHDKVC